MGLRVSFAPSSSTRSKSETRVTEEASGRLSGEEVPGEVEEQASRQLLGNLQAAVGGTEGERALDESLFISDSEDGDPVGV